MTKGRSRWPKKWALGPLPHERQPRPRSDGGYETATPPVSARFDAEGSVVFGGENDTWRVDDDGRLWIATASWQCEGWIGLHELYLRCGRTDTKERLGLKMSFAEAEPKD